MSKVGADTNTFAEIDVTAEFSLAPLRGASSGAEAPSRRLKILVTIFALCWGLSACGSLEANVAAGVVGSTLYGGQSPTHEIEQIYYLGTFDPQEQLPPTIYRVRVHGQASAISGTKFASGWVPARVIDSLNTHVGFDVNDPASRAPTITEGEARLMSELETGRRLVQFGPEGFRPAPADHRLVIVMGASPQAFFQAIDQSLGQLGQFRAQKADEALKSEVLEALLALKGHQDRLDDLDDDVEVFLLQSAVTAGAGAQAKAEEEAATEAATAKQDEKKGDTNITVKGDGSIIDTEKGTVIKKEPTAAGSDQESS